MKLGLLDDHDPCHTAKHAVVKAWKAAGVPEWDAHRLDAVGMIPADATAWGLPRLTNKHGGQAVAFLFACGLSAPEATAWLTVPGIWNDEVAAFHAAGWTPEQTQALAVEIDRLGIHDFGEEMAVRAAWCQCGIDPQIAADAVRVGLSPQEAVAAGPDAIRTLAALTR